MVSWADCGAAFADKSVRATRADGEAEDVGVGGEVAGAGAVSGGFDFHFWKFGEAGGESGDDGCAGGGDQLGLDADE